MRHLKLVGSEPAMPPRRKGLRPPPVLSAEQERAAKAAIRGLAQRYGSQRKLSVALGLHPLTVAQGLRKGVSAELVLRAALTCKVPVETLITPGPRDVAP